MAPVEFQAYMEVWEYQEQRLDHRAGTIAAASWEVYRDRDKRAEPFHSSDFFPSIPKPDRGGPSTEEAKHTAEVFFRNLEKIKDKLPKKPRKARRGA